MDTFDCPNDHLVVGPQLVDPPRCPECPEIGHIGRRWKFDPYVTSATDIAEMRGLLSGPDMSGVQIAMLTAAVVRRREIEQQKEVERFEHDLMLQRPELWQQYQELKGKIEDEDDIPDSMVEWRFPKTAEEARQFEAEINAALAEANVSVESTADDDWDDWDLSEIGD